MRRTDPRHGVHCRTRSGIADCIRRRVVKVIVAVLAIAVQPCVVRATQEIIVQVRPGQSIQDMASEYLGDASLWQSILEHNGLQRADQIVPWMRLRIPATGVAIAAHSINQAQGELSLAMQAGGRLFAGGLLDQSRQKLEEAQVALRAQNFLLARELAEHAYGLAQQARRVASSASNVAVQAVLENFNGVVETQRPDELAWRRAEPRMRLVEGERIRTRSNSFAEIVFRDNSRLRLNANSLMVISEIRQDVLLNKNHTSVAVIQGDVLAYLAELRETNRFDLLLPDVRTYVASRSFWVNRDQRQLTRLAVYEGQIAVVASGDSIVIRENQGATLRPNRAPERPRELLPAPQPRAPENNRTFYNTYPTLSWLPVARARAYRLEIGSDIRFHHVHTVIPELERRRHTPRRLPRGIYFWRVSAVDSSDFPGPPSEPRMFVMHFDHIPPFIVIKYPRRLVSFTADPFMSISGEMETGVAVTVNGQPIDQVGGDQFRFAAPLSGGENQFTITARDSGGNETTVLRRIVRQERAPDVEVLGIESEELSFITNTPFFTMNGQTETGSRMTIWRVDQGRISDSTDVPVQRSGSFTLTLKLDHVGASDYVLEAVDRAGNRSNKQIRVVYDDEPPELILATPTYVVTQEDSILIEGRIEAGSVLLVNQQAVLVDHGAFSTKLPLPLGRQFFTVAAEDDAGNRSEVRMTVVRDVQAPRLLERTVSPARVNGGEVVTVTVRAADNLSGLPRTARYRVTGPGGFVFEGILVARGRDGRYVGQLLAPPGVRGTLRLDSVELSDLVGNKRTIAISAR